MAETNTYNHGDIIRYLQHKMSPQEMHAFEKTLMDDPFLADAMGGFAAGDQQLSAKHLAEIESQLTGRKEETKIVALPPKKVSWWRVAAVILVVATGGVLTYSLINQKGNPTIAVQEMSKNATPQSTATADSIGPVEQTLAKAKLPEPASALNEGSSPAFKTRANKQSAPPIAAAPDTLNIVAMDARSDNARSVNADLQGRSAGVAVTANKPVKRDEETENYSSKMMMPERSLNTFRGKVVNETGEPVAGSYVELNNSKTTAIADENGNFTIQAPDSFAQVRVGNLGYNNVVAAISSKAEMNKVTLQSDAGMLSEVVVTKVRSKAANRTSPGDSSTAVPIGGWKNFEQYLRRQIDSLKAGDNDNYFSNDVILEFSINGKGQPTNIKVKEQSNPTAAETAVKILTNGPKWSRKKDRKVKVTIPF